MATPLARGWEIVFRLACATRRGDSYQDLFADIMERRDAGFQRVRPWGNVGDRKNDGWSPTRRQLFQCYAPSTMTAANLVAKLEEDYAGASAHWEGYFDHWTFVHNDLDGMGPEVALKIGELDNRSASIRCSSWGFPELREEFACLTDSDRVALLGPQLTKFDFVDVDAATLSPLIAALGQMSPDPAAKVAPVPADKIEANDLSDAQVKFLTMGSARAPLVESYLSNAYLNPAHVDGLAEAVSTRYVRLRDEDRSAEQIFDELLCWVTGGVMDSKSVANALAILAYFFDRCHIFEVPQAGAA